MLRSRRRWGAVVVLTVAAAATAYLLLVPRQSGHVAVPPGNATPDQVVTAYLHALDAHDCETAKALMTSDSRSIAASWCEDIGSLTDVDVHTPRAEDPRHSGQPATAEVVRVPVRFNLTWRPFHSDISMDEGVTTWGYLLIRASSASPWRIFDHGAA